MPSFIVVIIIGGVVGFLARLLYPGPNTPRGFLVTIVLGVAGAALATFGYRWIGLIESNRLADPISMVVAALILLFVWNRLAAFNVVTDPGMHHPEYRKEATNKSGNPTAD
jgi:uncharacterized membrane protein YeaQ/YmgE (transglycosylase-associated protein family)